MDGAIDLRLIITIGGILFSVAGAAAIGKMQIAAILSSLTDIEARLRAIDRRCDAFDTITEMQEQKLKILSGLLSPEHLRRDNMVMASALSDIEYLKKQSDKMVAMHNGSHPATAKDHSK